MALHAQYHPSQASSSSTQKRKSNFSSNTARESAVVVEWEPVSNLERRIEEGSNYQHDPYYQNFHENIRTSRRRRQVNLGRSVIIEEDDGEFIHRALGVFVGYRVTKEERDRLKSAHPME